MANLISRLPPTMQLVLGFAIIAAGLYTAVFAVLWARGDIVMQYVLCSIAAIYMLIGINPTIEAIMTINSDIERRKHNGP